MSKPIDYEKQFPYGSRVRYYQRFGVIEGQVTGYSMRDASILHVEVDHGETYELPAWSCLRVVT